MTLSTKTSMTSDGEVCTLCGSTERPLDIHEPPGRGVSVQVQCPVCGKPCHKYLTEKQRAAGFNLDHKYVHSAASRDYQFLTGATHVLGGMARSLGLSLLERVGRLSARATATALVALSEVGDALGPRPIRNDARRERRRRQKMTEYEVPPATRSDSIDRRRSYWALRVVEDTLADLGFDSAYFSFKSDQERLLLVSRFEELRASSGWPFLLNELYGLASAWMWHFSRLASIRSPKDIATILQAAEHLLARTDRVVSWARSLAIQSVNPQQALTELLADLWRW